MVLQIDTLLKLQEMDTEIGRIRKELARLDSGAELRRRFETLRAHCEKLDANLREERARLGDAELELKGVEQKKQEFEKRLYAGKVTNPKELTAIEREIDALGRHRGTLDERVLMAMDAIERVEGELARYVSARDRTEQEWKAADQAYRESKTKLEAVITEILPRREQIAAEVESTTLKRYEDLRARSSNLAIARLADATCGGCHTALARAVVQRVMDAETYVYCENCRRFLAPPA